MAEGSPSSDRFAAHGYTLLDELGRGGMAVVHRAYDMRHDRDVAIKLLHPDIAAALGPERFLREIRISASLTHPNILPVYDSGEVDGELYLVMPVIEGESLREAIRRKKQLAVNEVLSVGKEVADALCYAHSRGIVHRDIKPSNILLSNGHAIVADFGVARAITEASGERLTESGVAVGTAEYMSPEQAGGEGVDGRTDIYALGCSLYEALAGKPPFTGPTHMAILARHIQEPPPPLGVVRSALPPGVEPMITKALAKVPADRYRSCEEFIGDIEACASASGGSEIVPPEPGRGPVIKRLAATVAILLAVSLAVWQLLPPGPELDEEKVVVFSLVERASDGSELPPQAGEEVSLAIMAALEHAAPLRFIDPWYRLDQTQRASVATLTASDARDITVGEGARFYIDGFLRSDRGEATVTLSLHDAAGDSTIVQRSASGPVEELGLVGLDAVFPHHPVSGGSGPGYRPDPAARTRRRGVHALGPGRAGLPRVRLRIRVRALRACRRARLRVCDRSRQGSAGRQLARPPGCCKGDDPRRAGGRSTPPSEVPRVGRGALGLL